MNSNPFQESAFEASVYHYFLFKANQAATAAAREATEKRLGVGISTAPLNVLADTAANDKNNVDDGAKKPATSNQVDQGNNKPEKEQGDGAKNDDASPSAAQLPGAESIAKTMSAKYNRLAAAMKQDFPQYTDMVAQNAPFFPPLVSMRYTHFPPLEKEAGFLRQRVSLLEQQLQKQQAENQHLRRALDDIHRGPQATPAPQPRKRGRPPKNAVDSEERPSKRTYKRIHHRADVPDDIKAEVAQLRKESAAEKRAMKMKITRLEKKVSRKDDLVMKPAQASAIPAVAPPTAASPAAAHSAAAAKPPPAAAAPTKPSPKTPAGPIPTFESRFKELQDYHRANNTCRVPIRIPGLGRWCSEVRRNYRMAMENPETLQGKLTGASAELTQERIDRLNELDFEWNVAFKTVPWEQRFNEIVAYKETHGNTLVPRNWKENTGLGEWVHLQRKLRRKGSKVLEGERMEKLDSIGFAWSGSGPKKLTWEERLEECRDFRRKHGHLNVPDPPNPKKESEAATAAAQNADERSFQWWCSRQRDGYRKLQAGGNPPHFDKKRMKQLDNLGFDWKAEKEYSKDSTGRPRVGGGKKNEEIYNEQVAKLRRVGNLFGDCNDWDNVEQVYPGDTKLRYWVKTQRKQYKAWKKGEYSSLSTERRLSLEAIGFDFEPRKHYAPYGSKKKEQSEERAGAAALQAAAEAAAEMEQGDVEV